ncbi:MAG: MmcQ/YjbR family DNA-binding protein [Catenulispora sp.]|nr:MmcQ/YjbR family DNA-binding protein [Catenulispora sp.]
MATAEDVREIALTLPRAYEVWVRDRVKYRVGRIVFLSLSPDESLLGFGFPKEMREALVAAEPHKFLMPIASDMRYNWLRLRLAEVERDELWELIVDAWWGTVPKFVREGFMAGVEQERAAASDGTA